MIRKIILFCCFFFAVVFVTKGQNLAGIVKDSASEAALPAANVFINSSSIGVMTTDSGTFNINTGRLVEFDLIVSYVGYQTVSIHITDPRRIQVIRLKKKNDLLDEVTVLAADKNGWNEWGSLFKKYFIGTTTASGYCTILHPERIRFHFAKKDKILSAFAADPVTIVNKFLGYRIDFDLTKFEIDFNSRRVLYRGFPRFSQLKGHSSRNRFWEKNRKEVYVGSFMHFLRALHGDSLKSCRYEVRKIVKGENRERVRVGLLTGNFDSAAMFKFSNDSFYYYRRVQKEPELLDLLSAEEIPDSQFVKRMADRVLLDFEGMIHITCKGKKEEKVYAIQVRQAPGNSDVSGIVKLIHNPVVVTPSGQYFQPDDVFLDGYWGWSEKVANQLPVDYMESAAGKP